MSSVLELLLIISMGYNIKKIQIPKKKIQSQTFDKFIAPPVKIATTCTRIIITRRPHRTSLISDGTFESFKIP